MNYASIGFVHAELASESLPSGVDGVHVQFETVDLLLVTSSFFFDVPTALFHPSDFSFEIVARALIWRVDLSLQLTQTLSFFAQFGF